MLVELVVSLVALVRSRTLVVTLIILELQEVLVININALLKVSSSKPEKT